MNLDIWFYTFSSAAQVMAALVGLFAVFVVYKIQDFSQLINEARSALSRLLPYVSANIGGGQIPAHVMMEMSDEETLEKFAEILALHTRNNSFNSTERVGNMTFTVDDTTYDYCFKLINKKKRILQRLLFVLIVCLGTIALSLASLVATNLLANPLNLWLSLLLFLLCLIEIGRGTYDITRE